MINLSSTITPSEPAVDPVGGRLTPVYRPGAADQPLLAVVGGELRVPLVDGSEHRYVNLDYAASAPALQTVVDRVTEFLPFYSSVHRGAGYASAVSTAVYEAARREIGHFVGARSDDVVIVTRNTTDGLNLLAGAVPGRVVHLDVEHHANLLPWRGRDGEMVTAQPSVGETVSALGTALERAPAALLAVTGASNVTGECLPLAELAGLAHRYGARIAVDAAQLAPHRRLDIAALELDYVAFSGHKLYAPFGAGALVGRRDWLDAAPPYLAGGGAVVRVRADGTSWTTAPARHEAGTPNVVGAVALAAACRALINLGASRLIEHEQALLDRLLAGLSELPAVSRLRQWTDAEEPIAMLSFTVEGRPAELVAQYLSAEHGIGVRDGRFCAHLLLDRLAPKHDGTAVRASFGLGSRLADVDRLLVALEQLVRAGPRWTYSASDGYGPVPDPRSWPQWIVAPTGPASACA